MNGVLKMGMEDEIPRMRLLRVEVKKLSSKQRGVKK